MENTKAQNAPKFRSKYKTYQSFHVCVQFMRQLHRLFTINNTNILHIHQRYRYQCMFFGTIALFQQPQVMLEKETLLLRMLHRFRPD